MTDEKQTVSVRSDAHIFTRAEIDLRQYVMRRGGPLGIASADMIVQLQSRVDDLEDGIKIALRNIGENRHGFAKAVLSETLDAKPKQATNIAATKQPGEIDGIIADLQSASHGAGGILRRSLLRAVELLTQHREAIESSEKPDLVAVSVGYGKSIDDLVQSMRQPGQLQAMPKEVARALLTTPEDVDHLVQWRDITDLWEVSKRGKVALAHILDDWSYFTGIAAKKLDVVSDGECAACNGTRRVQCMGCDGKGGTCAGCRGDKTVVCMACTIDITSDAPPDDTESKLRLSRQAIDAFRDYAETLGLAATSSESTLGFIKRRVETLEVQRDVAMRREKSLEEQCDVAIGMQQVAEKTLALTKTELLSIYDFAVGELDMDSADGALTHIIQHIDKLTKERDLAVGAMNKQNYAGLLSDLVELESRMLATTRYDSTGQFLLKHNDARIVGSARVKLAQYSATDNIGRAVPSADDVYPVIHCVEFSAPRHETFGFHPHRPMTNPYCIVSSNEEFARIRTYWKDDGKTAPRMFWPDLESVTSVRVQSPIKLDDSFTWYVDDSFTWVDGPKA